MSMGTIYGVGLGPGDPELMSVKADRLVRRAAHVAYFRKSGLAGRARGIVSGLLRADAREHPMDYPLTTEIPVSDPRYNAALSAFYATSSAHLRALAESGEDVMVLCEGDPFFYGSFMHLHIRLRGHVPVVVVPAITGMSAAWTATGAPVTWGDDALTVLAGTLPEAELARRMAEAEALVVMKIGRNLGRVRRALESSGKAEAAFLVEYASMAEERVIPLHEVKGEAAPYFSIIIVHGQGRRP